MIPLPLTNGGWEIIYADPPWKFASNSTSKPGRNASRHYPTMTIEQIAAMPVAEIVARDALLLLWTTTPMNPGKINDVIEAWGFVYKSQVIWDKQRVGTGYWARGQHEILMICRRRRFHCPRPLFQSSVISEMRREHSRKPDQVRQIIDASYPSARKLELFARTEAPGWTAWGNQTGRFQ